MGEYENVSTLASCKRKVLVDDTFLYISTGIIFPVVAATSLFWRMNYIVRCGFIGVVGLF